VSTRHVPGCVGDRDRDGWRTFETPGDVCLGCSDVEAGHWVPVSDCPTALAIFEFREADLARQQDETLRYLAERGRVSE
jgi:hypothetical protein